MTSSKFILESTLFSCKVSPMILSLAQARKHWMVAQGLHRQQAFGKGKTAVLKAIQQLGYVQIDTIHVIERSHHHILFSRVPDYQKSFLHDLQTKDKTVFEYWTHALSYVPTADYRYYMPSMKRSRDNPSSWFREVKPEEVKKVLRLLKQEGPISIRDVQDDELVEKNHPWASRKPSKKAMQYGFYNGDLVISERVGMLKKYDLAQRHFAWEQKPQSAKPKEILEYLLQRALRSQCLVSLDSICYMDAKKKADMRILLQQKTKKGELLEIQIAGELKTTFWMKPEVLESKTEVDPQQVHILSPFDPLIIQRKRLKSFFNYDHKFEAYLPKEKRVYGYFALPVLIGDEVRAILDLKTDRQNNKLLIQQWTWHQPATKKAKTQIEQALHTFEKFQLLT